MSDLVQSTLEGMAVELNLLAKAKLFTRKEVRAIVRRRKRFEYLIRRHGVDRHDFVKYLSYETRLERLREKRLRRHAAGQAAAVALHPLVRGGGIRHIHFVYARALKKFPGDVGLWRAYVAFCQRTGASRSIANALGRALALHPRVAPLWAFAARWELESNANIRNARAIMHRALRVNPESADLLVEYAALELLILNRARAATVVERKPGEEGGSPDVGVSVDMALLPPEEGRPDVDADSPFFKAAVPLTIFKYAIHKLPEDGDMRVSFLRLFAAFDGCEEHEKEVATGITDDFPGDAGLVTTVADWAASRGGIEAASKVFENAIARAAAEGHSSEALWEAFAGFVAAKSGLDVESAAMDSATARRASEVCARADETGAASIRVYELWLTCAAVLEDEPRARDIAVRATAKWPGCAKLWNVRVALEARARAETDAGSIKEKLLREAIAKAKPTESHELWASLVSAKCRSGEPLPSLLKVCTEALVKICGVRIPRSAASAFATAAVSTVAESHGVTGARAFCDVALRHSACISAEFCTAYIAAERADPKRTDTLTHLRKFFARVLDGSPLGKTETALWIAYHRMEQDAGNMSEAASIYRRARSTLVDPTEFLESFSG